MKKTIHFLLLFCFSLNIHCNAISQKTTTATIDNKILTLGIERPLEYLPLLKDKKVALVVNQTSMNDSVHLVDLLLAEKVFVEKIFAPEHGFRGTADAGEKINDGIDAKTGLPIVSLYGSHKKPTIEDLQGIDIVVFDIQDVGARFYTYISTLHYIMEACAENNIQLLVLDRPNPNGHFVDGYVLEPKYKSFVGMHPVPIVHGMTIAEYAEMINGEKWLKNGIECDLKIVKCLYYNRNEIYVLPIKPSPNLPNAQAINLYPSLCFFEGTQVSVGRGTTFPFQTMALPTIDSSFTSFSFTPKSTAGAKYPKHQNKVCYGFDLRNENTLQKIQLDYLIKMYNLSTDKDNFFLKNLFIDKLAGTDRLRKAIVAQKTADEIRLEWQNELNNFKTIRKKYLLYF